MGRFATRLLEIVSRADVASDVVDGHALRVTSQELAAADKCEVDDHHRVQATLESGTRVWVYGAPP